MNGISRGCGVQVVAMCLYLGGVVFQQLLSGCGASCAMQELIGKYIVLENYFMSESLFKVHPPAVYMMASVHCNLAIVCVVRVGVMNVGCTHGPLVSWKPHLLYG